MSLCKHDLIFFIKIWMSGGTVLCAVWWWCFLIDERHCAGQLCKPTGEELIAGEEGVWYEGTGAR